MKHLVVVFIVLLLSSELSTQTFQTSSDGNWSDNQTWSSQSPGSNQSNLTIHINHNLILDNLKLDYTNMNLIIEPGASLVFNKSRLRFSGYITVLGLITTNSNDISKIQGINKYACLYGQSNVDNSIQLINTTDCSALPVELLDFNVCQVGNHILIDWSTASEINNSHFEIEKSLDGQTFSTIAEVRGADNSNQITSYNYTDTQINFGMIFYRLKQIDHDGGYEYFGPVDIQVFNVEQTGIYPNPVSNEEYLTIQNSTNKVVEIYDMTGRLIRNKQIWNNKIHIDLSKGVYILKQGQKTHRLIVN